MPKTFAALALLALAAAARAQAVTLLPTSTTGYLVNYSTTNGTRSGSTVPTTTMGLNTQWYYDHYTGYGYYLPPRGDWTYGYITRDTIRQAWWRTQFNLPATPAGMALVAATFSANANGTQTVGIGFYNVASGTPRGFTGPSGTSVSAAPGTVRIDVTSGIRSLLDASATVAGLEITPRTSTNVQNQVVGWSSPTLTLVYGYPVRAPLALGNFVGDPTKVAVAYQVRQPGTHTVVNSGTVYPDASGNVSPLVPPGTWDVSLKASHWLRRTLKSVTIADGSSTLPAVSLVNGDVNGDNVVSAADRAMVTTALGSAKGDALYSDAADVTGDGYVTAKDRAIVTLALGAVGDD